MNRNYDNQNNNLEPENYQHPIKNILTTNKKSFSNISLRHKRRKK